jgi:effector-binding domain-containing protein
MSEIILKSVAPKRVAAVQTTCTYGEALKKLEGLHEWAHTFRVKTIGHPMVLIYATPEEFDLGENSFELCLHVEGTYPETDGIVLKEIGANELACISHRGPYDRLGAAYERVVAWLAEYEYEIVLPTRQELIVAPGPSGPGDPERFLTEVQIPVIRG